MELTNMFVAEIRQIIDNAQRAAYRLADLTLVRRNWLLGQRIAKEELGGADRAEYGAEIIKSLSRVLTAEYGKGFDRANLYHFLNFYKAFPIIEEQEQIVNSPSRKLEDIGKVYAVSRKSDLEILETPCPKFSTLLSWTHYRILQQGLRLNRDSQCLPRCRSLRGETCRLKVAPFAYGSLGLGFF